MEEDYLDDNEELVEDYYQSDQYEDDGDDLSENDGTYEDYEDSGDEDSEEGDDTSSDNEEDSNFIGITNLELKYIHDYDRITALEKNLRSKTGPAAESAKEELVKILISAHPVHTSGSTVESIKKVLLMKQGKDHKRLSGSVYKGSQLNSEDVKDFEGGGSSDEDYRINTAVTEEATRLVDRFFAYLLTLPNPKDDEFTKRIKRRHIPAFIIFLFNAGLYNLLPGCNNIPPAYKKQIDSAFDKMNKSRMQIIEDIIKEYEAAGRHEVANKVREVQMSWFNREPAKLKTSAWGKELNLTDDDIRIYKKYRNKYLNITSVAQQVISEYIQVIINEDAGIYEKLKDKTRGEAIVKVKNLWKEWVKDQGITSDVARKIIWNDLDECK